MESIIRNINLAKSGHEKISKLLRAKQSASAFIWKLKQRILQKYCIVLAHVSS